ncbi:MAG: 1-deoxy-D-xylulose-5-phosphate reductoisomerase [Lachnospiraceae bacterium]|nr:1-deoxy-D-xylulose-5-phosphate reductoisomerase [Lachnospiraceae bacterium]
MRNLAILGSTGSIGTQTLDIVSKNNDLKVISLAAYGNIELLEKQIRQYMPKLACVYSEEKAAKLKENISDLDVKVVSGMDGLIEAASMDEADIVVTAIVGMIGIRPTMAAIKAGKDIALANKETLVTAGHIIIPAAKEYNVNILPVDSEHSAIFQCLNGERKADVDKILLTASGGPFRGKTRADLENVTVEAALKHPNWAMGRKITIDSATLVNKGLEVIEAKWLFDVDFEDIDVVVQPQSLIHSMVQFKDGGIMAQLGTPDMRLPIQYAIYYPERRYLDGDRVDFSKLVGITFEKPDTDTFEGLKLAYEAGKCGGSTPTVFNAANELAVAMFLDKKIRFLDIYEIIKESMNNIKHIDNPSIEQILDVEKETYEFIRSRWN